MYARVKPWPLKLNNRLIYHWTCWSRCHLDGSVSFFYGKFKWFILEIPCAKRKWYDRRSPDQDVSGEIYPCPITVVTWLLRSKSPSLYCLQLATMRVMKEFQFHDNYEYSPGSHCGWFFFSYLVFCSRIVQANIKAPLAMEYILHILIIITGFK